MILEQVTLCIILIESAEEGSELKSFISIGNEFEENMPSIFFEDMKSKKDGEEITDLYFKTIPHFSLYIWKCQELFFI